MIHRVHRRGLTRLDHRYTLVFYSGYHILPHPLGCSQSPPEVQTGHKDSSLLRQDLVDDGLIKHQNMPRRNNDFDRPGFTLGMLRLGNLCESIVRSRVLVLGSGNARKVLGIAVQVDPAAENFVVP